MSIERVGVIGAGFMGSGIAESAAAAGIEVTLYEPAPEPLARSRQSLEASVARSVARERMTAEDGEALLGRISHFTDRDALGDVQAVLEAVVEDPRIKGKLFVPIAELASRTQRPERVIGLHFFSPVPVMKLVEVVVGLQTDHATATVAEGFAEGIGKRPIRTKDRSGFIVNMLWFRA